MITARKRVLVAAVVMGLAAWFGSVPAGAANGTPVVNPSTVAPGQGFTVSGEADCIQGTTLTVSVTGLPLSKTVSGDAAWELSFTMPSDAAVGTYPVVVDGSECNYPDASVTVAIPGSISLVKTVGTTAGVCATTTSISVAAGTTVYYCYTVTNNTQSTLATHSLTDDKLGSIMTDVASSLAPGASVNTVTLGKTVSAVINATTTNIGTWTAMTDPGVPFTATASATVTVTQPASTTTTAAAAPAVAAAATPAFTG